MNSSLWLAWSLARFVAPSGPDVPALEPESVAVSEADDGAAVADEEDPPESEGAADAPLPELEPLPELPPLDELPDLDPLPELPATTTGPADGSPSSISSAGEAEPADEGLRLGDVMTGSLRITGAFLHFDDIPELYPTGDDGLFATVGRVMVDRDWNGRYGLEMNYFIDFSRTPTLGGGSGGAFGTAGSTASAYRSPFLGWILWEDGSVRSTAGVDRFAFDAKAGPVSFKIGRFPISYSVGGFFTPNDFLAPFSVTAVNRIYKPGVDAIQVGAALGMRGSVELTGVLGNDFEGTPTWGRSAILARASVVGGGFEWAALGGKLAERWVIGAGVQGGIGPVGLHGEGHFGIPDVEGDGRDTGPGARPMHVRLTAGPTFNVGWKGLTLGADYGYFSDGAVDPALLLSRSTRLFPDDVPLLGRHYAGAVASMEIIPILRASTLTMVNAGDGSGLAGLSLVYSLADEADLLAGVFVPWGKDPSVVLDPSMDPMLQATLGSELGASPLSLYLEARTFF